MMLLTIASHSLKWPRVVHRLEACLTLTTYPYTYVSVDKEQMSLRYRQLNSSPPPVQYAMSYAQHQIF